jgi:ectoine hydroxylase-related dioxygenase (phytanoyl-CoA dioxygenase family)
MTDTTALPALDTLYDVDAKAIQDYRRDGHVVLRGVCSSGEIDAYGPVIKDAAFRYNRETRPLEERETYGKAFLQVPNIWTKDEAVAKFVLAKRFAKIAADLLEVQAVRLYHDQALFKEAGGGRTPWHQDMYYWPLDTDRTITMWMPLVDVPAEVGSMGFASGSQKLGFLGEYAISDESEAAFAKMLEDQHLEVDTHGALKAGDATFHDGWILHSAPANPTGNLRAVMTVIYHADGTNVVAEVPPYQAADLKKWLPGCVPGGPAVSELNPLLWPAETVVR